MWRECKAWATRQFSVKQEPDARCRSRQMGKFWITVATNDVHVVRGTVGDDPQASITAVTGNGDIDVKRGN